MLRRGHATGREMSQLLGSWAWIMLLFRPSLSVFRAVYRFANVAQSRRFSLWNSARYELETALRILPLLSSNLRSHFFSRCAAVDASSLAQGVTMALISPSDSMQMQHASSLQNIAFRSPHLVDSRFLPLLEHSSTVHQFLHSSRWTTIVSSGWRWPDHINALETRAAYTAVRWCASFPSGMDSRFTILTDSRVAMFALNKGRSSSQNLYAPIRTTAAFLLAFGIRLQAIWIPSEQNPADAPSRKYWEEFSQSYQSEFHRIDSRRRRLSRAPLSYNNFALASIPPLYPQISWDLDWLHSLPR